MARVLVVDDESSVGKIVATALERDGHSVTRVDGGRGAVAALDQGGIELVVTDLRMPDVDGLAVLKKARGLSPPIDVILMTAHGTAESAVAAMKAGAADYLLKPFAIDELRLRVRRLAEQHQVAAAAERLARRLTPRIVAESARMQEVVAAARRVAPTAATVLLLGETGTGKSQLARFIHFTSTRAAAPLVEVHCAALPETLLESELFGHEKGAFTGAAERKRGHLAAAEGGTLFLDEIGEVTLSTQVKLLRFLQDREFVPVGSTQARKVDVRVIAATNRDLAEAVRTGAFREDLYYRLNVFSLESPPLRERLQDVGPLTDAFLDARGLPPAKLTTQARRWLLEQPWPGNVRELENALERALILSGEEEIEPRHLGPLGRADSGKGAGDAGLVLDVLGEGFAFDAFVVDLVHAAIEKCGGNKAAAARRLGVTRRRLYTMLQSRGASVDEEEGGD